MFSLCTNIIIRKIIRQYIPSQAKAGRISASKMLTLKIKAFLNTVDAMTYGLKFATSLRVDEMLSSGSTRLDNKKNTELKEILIKVTAS